MRIGSQEIEKSVALPPVEPVLVERREGVCLLTLNRPERLNAWNHELESRYFAHLAAADRDVNIKAIVVTGAGRDFCAAADMDDLERASDDPDVGSGSLVRDRTRPRAFPLTVRTPMIAAINGTAAGLGLVEALYCNVRFATPDARLTTAFARRGLIVDYRMSWLLPRIVGLSAALDLLLSGRVVRGDEGHRVGLVNRLSDPESLVADAVEYAHDLAERCSPWSVAAIKGFKSRPSSAAASSPRLPTPMH